MRLESTGQEQNPDAGVLLAYNVDVACTNGTAGTVRDGDPGDLGATERPSLALTSVIHGGRTRNDPDHDLIGVGVNVGGLVEHIGFEPMTSSMPWKRASQLRQCPLPAKNRHALLYHV